MATLGWGIVGTGRGAGELVAPAIATCEGMQLVGVVSRDEQRANEFAQMHGASRALTSYDELLADPSVDVGRRAELETIALALIRFSNGALAYVNANQAVPDSQPDIAIYGVEGRILGRSVMRPNERGELSVTRDGRETTTPTSSEGAFTGIVAAFRRAIIEDEEPSPSGVDGLRSAQITDALNRSAREGRAVELAFE